MASRFACRKDMKSNFSLSGCRITQPATRLYLVCFFEVSLTLYRRRFPDTATTLLHLQSPGCVTLSRRHCCYFGVFTKPAGFLTKHTTRNGTYTDHRQGGKREVIHNCEHAQTHTLLQVQQESQTCVHPLQNDPSGTLNVPSTTTNLTHY